MPRTKRKRGKSAKVSRAIYEHIATLGPVGYMPIAPGTFGTLAALVILLLLKPSAPAVAVLLVLLSAIGVVASDEAERMSGEKDPPHIVIDEAAGYLFAMAFLPQTPVYFAASFALFRAFDILKPPPIRRLQRLAGGVGVMADDVVSGVFTNVILQICRLLIPG